MEASRDFIRVITMEDEGITGSVNKFTGIMQGHLAAESTLRDLQFILNFNVTLEKKAVDSGNANYFNLVADELILGRADLAIGYFYITRPRVEFVAPLIPVMSDGLFAFFSQPPASSVKNIYTSSFHSNTLIVFFAILIFIGLSLVHLLEGDEEEDGIKYLNAAFWTIFVACQTGSSISSKRVSLRIMILSGLLLSLFIYSMFSGMILKAILLPVTPIKRVGDIAEHRFTVFAINAARHIVFGTGNNFRRVNYTWRTSIPTLFKGGHADIGTGLSSLRGFLYYVRRLENAPKDEEICEKISILRYSQSNMFISSGFFVAKNSSLRDSFNIQILRIKNSGLLNRYLVRSAPPPLGCFEKQMSYQENLGMDTVLPGFICFGACLGLSFFLFAMEIIFDVEEK